MPAIDLIRKFIGIPPAGSEGFEYIIAAIVMLLFLVEIFDIGRFLLSFIKERRTR